MVPQKRLVAVAPPREWAARPGFVSPQKLTQPLMVGLRSNPIQNPPSPKRSGDCCVKLFGYAELLSDHPAADPWPVAQINFVTKCRQACRRVD